MKQWHMVALCALLVTAGTAARAADARFSQTLTTAEWTATGLEKLSSDQRAVLDALIRRDEKIYAVRDDAHPAPARFSQRLSPAECRSAGLGLLNETELIRLDTAVDHYESGNPTASASGPAHSAWRPELRGPAPEIHGMISFTYGTGRGGYNSMGGAMAVSVDDPAHGFSLLVGYGESRSRVPIGGWGYDRRLRPGYLLDPPPPLFP
jgi:hypothetical protein